MADNLLDCNLNENVSGREGLETSILGLEFIARHKHFKRGNMKLKCLATIATVYLVSNEESVEGERPQKASVLESRGTAAPASGSRADRVQGKRIYDYLLIYRPLRANESTAGKLPVQVAC